MKIEDVEEILPDDGRGKVAIRLLDEQQVAKGAGVTEERQLVGAPAAPFQAPRSLEEDSGLVEKIERKVAERQLLFEHRRMAAPLREAVAEDESIVTTPYVELGKVSGSFVVGHHRPRIPRGTL
jgi:hypothetical protein